MAEQLRRVRISVPAAVVMIFVFVSSGAFGLEDMASSGAGMMVLMLVALPFVWALPMALVCSELGSALPEEGGYYIWVRRALGEFWGFQCGWWAWTCQFVDSAVYIALVLGYVGSWWPQLNGWELWLIGAALIALFAVINIRGLDLVALSSIVFTVIIVAPFVIMTVLGFAHWHGTPLQPFLPSGESWWSSIGLGLAVGVWMYSGFDSMSTIAGEIERPRFVIPKALMISVPIIIASYLLPTIVGLAGVGHWQSWTADASGGGISFVQMARTLGGPILGYLMLGAAVISNMALYQEYLAQGSRPAYAMAADHLLPSVLTRTHHKYGTPWVSIVFLAAVNALLVRFGFKTLIVIDVFLMMFYYILIFVAAIRLRVTEPGLERPFRVRGTTLVLALICAPAMAIAVIALFTNGGDWLIGGLAGVLTGPVAYLIFKPACRPRGPEAPAAAEAPSG